MHNWLRVYVTDWNCQLTPSWQEYVVSLNYSTYSQSTRWFHHLRNLASRWHHHVYRVIPVWPECWPMNQRMVAQLSLPWHGEPSYDRARRPRRTVHAHRWVIIMICLFRTRGTIMKWYKYKWRICQKKYNTHASYMSSTQSDEGTYSLVLQNNTHIWYHSSAIFNNMQFPQSDETIRMNQILASDHHCLYMLWALLSLVLDHLFQYQQCWQCFRTDNHWSNFIASWCILHSHQLCPSYGGHCKCWCRW